MKLLSTMLVLSLTAGLYGQEWAGRWHVGAIGSAIKMVEGGRDHSTVEQWAGLTLGYAFSNRLSADLGVAYGWVRARKLGVSQFDSRNTYPFKTNLVPVLLNLNYRLLSRGKLIPFLSLGAGATYWDVRDLRTSDLTTFANGRKVRAEVSPTVSGAFGLDFMLNHKFALTTSVRYNRLLKGNEDTSGLQGFNNLPGDPNKAIAEVQVGLKLFWGGNPDKDGDGLRNEEEKRFGTDPKVADTDGDGLDDFAEIYTYQTNPVSADTDQDLVTDAEEVRTYRTDPSLVDTDADGLRDGEEVRRYRTDPLTADTDQDGLTDGEEAHQYGTDPLTADTESDGLSDGEEIKRFHSDPTKSDTDGDGLPDAHEVARYGTNPGRADTDAGGTNDAVEITRGTSPLDPNDDVVEEVLEPGPKILEGIQFEVNSAEIRPESEPVLESVLETFVKHPEMHVVIHGYTDNTGSRAYNLELSQRRAEAVKRWLVLRGVEPERIKAIGFGPDNPIAPNTTPEGRRQNRRIEFVVVE